MNCLLCDSNDDDTWSNLDDEKIYAVTAKYFEMQLRDMYIPKKSVLCTYCWTCIEDFHNFQQKVLRIYEELLKSELKSALDVKQEEMEIMLDATPSSIDNQLDTILTDPMAIEDNNLQDGADVNGIGKTAAAESSDDDKPLSTIVQEQKTHATDTQRKQRCKSNAAETEAKIVKKRNLKALEQDSFIAEHWKGGLQCDLCELSCNNFANLRKHFRAKHNNENGYVVCCERKHYHRFQLVDHLKLHLNPQSFQCDECDKCCTNSRLLAMHIKTSHCIAAKERRYQCDICEKRFAKIAVLRQHMETHATGSKDYICPHCDKGFVVKNRLNVHIRSVHCSPSVCELCGKSFRNRYALEEHLLTHNGMHKRKWPCDQCDAELNTKFSLKRHKRVKHNDGSTLYVCSECGKVALSAEALRSHKKYMHEKARKYKCNICEKAFKVALVLKEHMTTHTGERLYICPHCPKTFKVSANMHHHRKRVHPNEWAEGRQQRTFASQMDLSYVSNEVVL